MRGVAPDKVVADLPHIEEVAVGNGEHGSLSLVVGLGADYGDAATAIVPTLDVTGLGETCSNADRL